MCLTSAVTLFLLTPPRQLFPCLALFAIVYLHPNSSLLGEYGLSLLKPSKWLPSLRFVRIHSFFFYCRQREHSEIWDCTGGGCDDGVFWDMAPCLLISSSRHFRSWSWRQRASRNVWNFCTSSTMKMETAVSAETSAPVPDDVVLRCDFIIISVLFCCGHSALSAGVSVGLRKISTNSGHKYVCVGSCPI